MSENQKSAVSSVSESNGVDLGKLPSYLGYQIRQTQAAIFRNLAGTSGDLGVSPGEFSLLTLVGKNPGIYQKILVQVYRLDKSTLSNAISDLSNRKLVRRIRDEDDRRFYGLWLTENGVSVLARATDLIEAQERQMDSVLEQGDREQILKLLARISLALD